MLKKTLTIIAISALMSTYGAAAYANGHGNWGHAGWGYGNNWHHYGGWGHGYYYNNYYNNGWWVLPAVATIASVAVIAASANNHQEVIYPNVYACQAQYGRYIYQGSFHPGGPCYVNMKGRVFAFTRYRPL